MKQALGPIKLPDAGRCIYCGDPAEMVCEHCEAEAERRNRELAKKEQADQAQARRGWFQDKIPEPYRDPDPARFPGWSVEAVRGFCPGNQRGITLQGPSDTFKTRTGVAMLEKAFVAGHGIDFRHAGDLRREINRAAREASDEALLRSLAKIPCLMIDDFGNQAFTETTEEFFLALLEKRHGVNQTIITTQYPSEEFIAKASTRRIGVAIARRIGPDFNTIIQTKKQP